MHRAADPSALQILHLQIRVRLDIFDNQDVQHAFSFFTARSLESSRQYASRQQCTTCPNGAIFSCRREPWASAGEARPLISEWLSVFTTARLSNVDASGVLQC